MNNTNAETMIMIRIVNREYLVDLDKIPFITRLVRTRWFPTPGTTAQVLMLDTEILFFGLINTSLGDGFGEIFGKISTRMNNYRRICETLKRLEIDVFVGRSLSDIVHELNPNYEKSDGDRQLTRDQRKERSLNSAFRLIYHFYEGDSELGVVSSSRESNEALSVLSHCSIYTRLARKLVKTAYVERCQVTSNQLERLEELPPGPPIR
jgi:hypothetical protein